MQKEAYGDTEWGHNKDGERERGGQVRQAIIPNTQSSSFFQDTEIHVDLLKTAAAMTQVKREREREREWHSLLQSRLSEIRDCTV